MYTEKVPLEIIPLLSGSASSVRYLVENDPNYNKRYKIIGAITDQRNANLKFFIENLGIVPLLVDIKKFYNERGQSTIKDMNVRDEYFKHIACLIGELSKGPVLILCAGFMLKITPALLVPFAKRIINVHPADLRVKHLTGPLTGKRKYTGLNVVKKAIDAGEPNLFSTIHFVEEEVDNGEIICVSDPFPVDLQKSSEEHQNEMKTACDGPAYAKALAMICDGEIKLG